MSDTTPLLVTDALESTSNARGDEDRPLPQGLSCLPKLQVLLLCFSCMIDPMAYSCIFPFINQVIFDMGSVKEGDVGFYARLIESLLALTATVPMLCWGRASDRVSRKPVLIASLAGVAVASASFGLAMSVWQMMVLRCFAGIFNGINISVRTMLRENSNLKNQARAFSFMAFASNVGMFFGTLLGGALAKPTEQYPWLFSSVHLFEWYPHLFPLLVTGCFAATAALLNVVLLHSVQYQRHEWESVHRDGERPSIRAVLASPGILQFLVLYQYNVLLPLAFSAVLPVFSCTGIRLGGFGFSPMQISWHIARCGISQVLWLLVVFPPLQRRVGTLNIVRACAVTWPIALSTFPMLNALLGTGHTTVFWVVVALNVIAGTSMSIGGSELPFQLTLNNISLSPLTLGTLNGIALTASSATRAIAPAVFSSIFAYGIKHQIIRGYLVWVIQIVIALGFVVAVRYWLPKKV